MRTGYECKHPNQEANILKSGFLGYTNALKSWKFPIDSTPKWCPLKNIKYYKTTLSVYEPNINGDYNTEPYVYMYKGAERMSEEDFNSLLWQCVEIERLAEGVTLLVEVRTEYDGEYIDGDDYEVTLSKVKYTAELSSFVDWVECSPKLPRIYAIDKEKSKMEVKVQ